MAFSPDGRAILTGSRDRTAKLWDASTGRELRRLDDHTDAVMSVAFSPDGNKLLTGSWDRTARLWDFTTGREVGRLEGHADAVMSVAFSPDGRTVLTGSRDRTARLWDATTRNLIRVLEGHDDEVMSVAFSPDGRTVLTGSRDRKARLWDAADGRLIRMIKAHADAVMSVAFSSDGRTFATGSWDRTARLWDATDGREVGRLEGHADAVMSVAFSPDGRTILTGSRDRTARLWDATTRNLIRVLEGHNGWVTCVTFAPDSRSCLTGSQDETARLYDAVDGREIQQLRGRTDGVMSVAFAPDGRTFATGSWDRTARLWDATDGREVGRLEGHADAVMSVAFSPDGRTVLTGSRDRTARLWDATTGREIRRLEGHNLEVTSVAFSLDGSKVLTGSWDRTARLWDAATGKLNRIIEGHADAVTGMGFSPDGRTIVTGSRDRTARLWDASDGREIRVFRGHDYNDEVMSVAFSPDGRTIVTGSRDRTARLWDVSDGREIGRLEGHRGWVTSVAFSHDGRTILTGSEDRSTWIWDAATRRKTGQLEGHRGWVMSVTFAPDDRAVLTGSRDRTTRLWTTSNNTEMCQLVSFNNGSWAVVDPSGRYDASDGGRVDGLHWAVGTETIELEQLKERYYDPGLLAKYLGHGKVPLRSVASLSGVHLYPTVAVASPAAGQVADAVEITLTDRGGGIGRVVVLVNGKEVTADDTRGGWPDLDPRSNVIRLKVPIAGDRRLIPGRPNPIEVQAYNAEGSLRSRGVVRVFKASGPAPPDPEMWAIIIGTSDYIGTEIRLRFAAKDAEAFSRALALAAGRMLGNDRVHIRTLSTDRPDLADRPTKANIEDAFGRIVKAARPTDLLVVYLAGHGVAPSGSDEYYYLTSDARSLELYDPEVRRRDALSGAELAELIRTVPPVNRQVLILDTCAAGRALNNLSQRRAVNGDQVRALERLQDRNGLHLLAGAAADGFSYEASQYGQGLLTYSLLLGMKEGTGLDGKELDVLKWFSHAVNEVPGLARGIGGIQKPLMSSPLAGATFPVGLLETEDRARIVLSGERTLILRSLFQEEESFFDVLGLAARVDASLKAMGEGDQTSPVFVDAIDGEGAYHLAGRYRIQADLVKVTVHVGRGDEHREAVVSGLQSQPDALAQAVAAKFSQMLRP